MIENLSFQLEKSVKKQEYVILLHGITQSNIQLKSIVSKLEKNGYAVINIDYPSTNNSFKELVDYVHEQIKNELKYKSYKVHFVGYSLGSQIIRSLLKYYRPKKLGRVVFIAPPNSGADIVDYLKDNKAYKAIFGQAGTEFSTDL